MNIANALEVEPNELYGIKPEQKKEVVCDVYVNYIYTGHFSRNRIV